MAIRDRARAALASLGLAAGMSALVVVGPRAASGDVITDWNQYLLEQVVRDDNRNPPPPGAPPNPFALGDKPPAVARQLAMIHAAMFDAVNTVEGLYQPYHVKPTGYDAADADVAAIWAAHDVAMHLFQNGAPVLQSRISSKKTTDLSFIPDGPGKTQGEALGKFVAQQIINLRLNDHSGDVVPYDDDPNGDPLLDAPTKPFGTYRMDQFSNGAQLPAAGTNWPLVTPFALTGPTQFRKAGPPSFTSAEYAAAIQQVREKGDRRRYYNSDGTIRTDMSAETAFEMRTAFFWAEKGLAASGAKTTTGTVTPPGHWNEIAREAIESKGLSRSENARLFALLNIAMADAAVASWDMKYAYDLWRPIHAIRLAAESGDPNFNPSLVPDGDDLDWETWLPLIPTSNHPEYSSGHSTFSGAAAEVLTHLLGTDGISFTITADDALKINLVTGQPDDVNGTKETRTFTSFWAAAEEAGMSRIYGGIHYQFSNIDGLTTGDQIGDWVLANFLTPVPEPASAATLLAVAAVACAVRRPRRRRVG